MDEVKKDTRATNGPDRTPLVEQVQELRAAIDRIRVEIRTLEAVQSTHDERIGIVELEVGR